MEKRILHIVPGLENPSNGIAVAARLMAREQNAGICDAKNISAAMIESADEVWVHSMWLPCVWSACRKALRLKKRLVRVTHANLDPVRLKYHGWKKFLVSPVEKMLLKKADLIVATCAEEEKWIRMYEPRVKSVEITDFRRFFNLDAPADETDRGGRTLHLLYLGRRHPLKGLEFLEAAVKGMDDVELRIESNVYGEEKEKVWDWCDVLVLPTLSENFGLVVAEALEKGKKVITTDGAPVWANFEEGDASRGRLIYLKGFCAASDEEKVKMVRRAIEVMITRKRKDNLV